MTDQNIVNNGTRPLNVCEMIGEAQKAKNMPVEEIMEFTGLTEEEVNAL